MSPIGALFHEIRAALHLSQVELAARVGASRRTGQRWDSGQATPSTDQILQLAKLVYPVDADLAARVAAAGGATLEALGLAQPPAPPPAALAPPAPPAQPATVAAPPADRMVDAVVCVAADEMGVPPRAVRRAVLAAFTRARELGLGVEAVERALGGGKASEGSAKNKRG